ncbi:MAG: hypothetical protein E5W86_13570 [Mesorhizobium sp.]|nr:MAG: hypothetical protein E5W86_13570 [Mesorhizobium sp.]
MDAVARGRGKTRLPAAAGLGRSVKIHDQAAALIVDMDVRRSDVFSQERALVERQRPAGMDPPRALRRIREGEPDVCAGVVGEIEIIGAEPARQPVGDPDQRRAVDVGAIVARQHARRDDGPVPPRLQDHASPKLKSLFAAFVQALPLHPRTWSDTCISRGLQMAWFIHRQENLDRARVKPIFTMLRHRPSPAVMF